MSGRPILIMAGGTGGHVYPALAVARALRAQSRDVVWLGTRAGLEARVIPQAGIAMEWISVGGLRGKSLGTWLLAPARLLWALGQSLGVMWRQRPAAVLGMGGFVTGPGGLAAWLTRRPIVIHEQNAVAGLSNRLLRGLAHEVLEGFPGSFGSPQRARCVGNPVREDITALPAPEQRLGARSGPVRLLVLGGSLGALVLNQTVPKAVALLAPTLRPQILHQCGERTAEQAREAYEQAGVDAQIEPFIEDMSEAYAWADIVVCRAGALTIAELSAAGLGAVLVPFPHAVDDHQTRNGQFLVEAGAALMMPQSDMTPDSLSERLTLLLSDRRRLVEMAQCARAVAQPEATAQLTAACVAAADVREGRA